MRQVQFTTSSYSREFISEPVAVSAGETYEFGGSYYLESTNDKPGDYRRAVRIKWLNDKGNVIDTESDFGDYQKFDEWVKVRVTEDAPQNAEQARVKIESKYTADEKTDVYWDDMFLTKIKK